MRQLRIKNTGPVRNGFSANDGFLDIKKVTVFIGNQASGKSTAAKLFSAMTWIEKALARGDFNAKFFARKNKFRNSILGYHRIENYLTDNSELEYKGEGCSIRFQDGNLNIIPAEDAIYNQPQILYIPAERNLVSYIKKPKELKYSSESMLDFLAVFEDAKSALKNPLEIPVKDAFLEYDRLNDTLNIKGEDYKIRLSEASSGLQSLTPMILVSGHLADTVRRSAVSGSLNALEILRFKEEITAIVNNESLNEEQKKAAVSAIAVKFRKTEFINIVEEPEQNLFPESQQKMLWKLLEFNNYSSGNKLLITTHSPYLISYLSLAVKAGYIEKKVQNNPSLLEKLYSLVPRYALLQPDQLAVYQFQDTNGTIEELPLIDGIPSDSNQLNQYLAKGNDLFDQLLEIEEQQNDGFFQR